MTNDTRAIAHAFLTSHKTGTLATVGSDGRPHASLVVYVFDEDFNIYFMTLRTSRKFAALSMHEDVAFTISSEAVPQTLQIEGKAADISSEYEAGSKKDDIFELLIKNSSFNAPISKMDTAQTAIIRITPAWVRWADYAFSEDGNTEIWKEIDLKK